MLGVWSTQITLVEITPPLPMQLNPLLIPKPAILASGLNRMASRTQPLPILSIPEQFLIPLMRLDMIDQRSNNQLLGRAAPGTEHILWQPQERLTRPLPSPAIPTLTRRRPCLYFPERPPTPASLSRLPKSLCTGRHHSIAVCSYHASCHRNNRPCL